MDPLVEHLQSLLTTVGPREHAFLVYDEDSPLPGLLLAGYAEALPDGTTHLYADRDSLLAALPPVGGLVVLLQSNRFETGDFRLRLELFRRGYAVIEHPHLGRIVEAEFPTYFEALAYDPAYFRGVGHALKRRLDGATAVELVSRGGVLRYRGPFEPTALNVGEYTEPVGGQFPIGEVFTEPVDLDGVDGVVTLGAYGALDFSVAFPEPFEVVVAGGRIVDTHGASAAFGEVLAAVQDREGEVRIRELGFGLNRAMRFDRPVSDVGAFERMCGVHISIGRKHAVYQKPGYSRRKTSVHLDVFCAVEGVRIDGEEVWVDGGWRP